MTLKGEKNIYFSLSISNLKDKDNLMIVLQKVSAFRELQKERTIQKMKKLT